jgi:hypothetical protein
MFPTSKKFAIFITPYTLSVITVISTYQISVYLSFLGKDHNNRKLLLRVKPPDTGRQVIPQYLKMAWDEH